MRRSVRWAVSAVCLIGAVWLGLSGSLVWKQGTMEETGITLTAVNRLETGNGTEADGSCGITMSQAENMRQTETEQEKPVGFTAWREEEGGTVTDEDGFRSAETTILRLCGTSEYLLAYGKILQREDDEGCLLGENVAEQLFGSHEAEGLTVLCDDRKLVVRGVIKEPAKIFILQETREAAVFDRITLEPAEISREAALKFRDRHGLGGMAVRGGKESPWNVLLGLVPGKWSDFDGWKLNAESYKKEADAEKKGEKGIFEMAASKHKKIAVVLLAGSAAVLLLGMAVGNKN